MPPMHGQHSSYPSSYSIKVIPYLDIVQDHLLCLDGGKEPVLWVDYTKVGTAAILQFPLDFIPLSNICIQSYNFPGLLVKYIINMRLGSWLGIMGIMPSRHRLRFHQQQQQDLNALLSQSLKANSNSQNKNFSDRDLCLFFNEL